MVEFFLQKLPFHHWILGSNWIFLLHWIFFFLLLRLVKVFFFFQSQQLVKCFFFLQKTSMPPDIKWCAPLDQVESFTFFFFKFSWIWSNFGSDFRKNLKIDLLSINIPNFTYDRGWYIRLILLPMLAAHPPRVFCNEYPYVYALYARLGGPGGWHNY